MKKIILSAIALGTVVTTTNAQSVRLGVKGGVNLANAQIVSPQSQSSPLSLGGYVGSLAEFSFKNPSDKFKGQIEINYDFYNLRNQYATGTNITRVHALSVPVLAKYFVLPEFSLFAGPTFNFNLASNETNTTFGDGRVDSKDKLNPFQMGAMVGANWYVYKGLFLEARYNYIAPQLYKTATLNPEFSNVNNLQLGIGYKF